MYVVIDYLSRNEIQANSKVGGCVGQNVCVGLKEKQNKNSN